MADSIKLFQFVQKCHQTFGIHPCQPNSKQKQLLNNSIKAIFLISYTQSMFETAAFLLLEAKSMFEYGFLFFILITITNCIAIYLIFVWQSGNTFEFIKNCEGFIKKRSQSTAAYNELIEKIELFNKFFQIGIFITSLFLCILLVALYSYVRYYIFDMGADSFYLFFPVWFPFDWKTPFGYLVACSAQCLGSIAITSITVQFLNLVFGSCWLLIFIADDITQDVAAFNITVKPASKQNRTKLTKNFCDTVQIYSDAKHCVMEFNHVFKYSLFAFFSWNMLALSGLLVTIQFELWADVPDSFVIALMTLTLIWVTTFMFLLCEPGERVSNQFNEFCDELNRCAWYLLPMGLQRCYLISISDTQNSIKVLSYANIKCERETSKKMINKAFSYFMTFRRFEA